MRSLLQKLVLESVVDTVKLELTEAKAAAIYNIRAWKDTSIKGAESRVTVLKVYPIISFILRSICSAHMLTFSITS